MPNVHLSLRLGLLSYLKGRALLALPALLLALPHLASGQKPAQIARAGIIYESSYRDNVVETFSTRGTSLGTVANVVNPTGMAFDTAGNLYVSSDDRPNYTIQKIAPDGTMTTFANTELGFPHGLAFDGAGNLFVANAGKNTILKFTADGIGSVFADENDGLATPIDLTFDKGGNLLVSNGYGGPAGTGSVLKFTPDGTGLVFADTGFDTAYGLAADRQGNLYVSNATGDRIEKFSRFGADLGVFGNAVLNEPLGIVFDRDGNLYIANAKSDTIVKLSPTGEDLGVLAQTSRAPHFLIIAQPTRTQTR